jgi:hypothetical protein
MMMVAIVMMGRAAAGSVSPDVARDVRWWPRTNGSELEHNTPPDRLAGGRRLLQRRILDGLLDLATLCLLYGTRQGS